MSIRITYPGMGQEGGLVATTSLPVDTERH